MASNEHAFLSEDNLHNPKGLSLAANNTICSKNNSGNLQWQGFSSLKIDNFTISGYCTLTTNYQYPESQQFGQSPYDINQDYGSATISAATTVVQKKFFRISNWIVNKAGVVNNSLLQVSSSDAQEFTVAFVKYTPHSSNTNAYPTVMFEKVVSGLSSDNKVATYTVDPGSDYLNTAVDAGDHLFIMIKQNEEAEAPQVYASLTLEIGYTT